MGGVIERARPGALAILGREDPLAQTLDKCLPRFIALFMTRERAGRHERPEESSLHDEDLEFEDQVEVHALIEPAADRRCDGGRVVRVS